MREVHNPDADLYGLSGLPYILPLAFTGDNWKVNTMFEENFYVQAEIKKYNKIVQEHHRKVIVIIKWNIKPDIFFLLR